MKKKSLLQIKKKLDFWVQKRNSAVELRSDTTADPLQVAKPYNDEYIALICALFAYGNANQIVKFLNSLDFDLLNQEENIIKKALKSHVYRFQNSEDITQFFITLKRLKSKQKLEDIFIKGYQKNSLVIDGLSTLLKFMYLINPYRSRGYSFLLGKLNSKQSPYKRWNMYLRWMVRKDELDMGLWSRVDKKDLLAPLDTHTHKMALKLGLIDRKSYDFKSCLELTNRFKTFDKNDPIKYDFALYRLGQENINI